MTDRRPARRGNSASPGFDPRLVLGRSRFVGAMRKTLEENRFLEVETPVLQPRLSGFEKGTGFSTFSSSLGERLWFRAAPELYLKRLIIAAQGAGMERIFEFAICLRDEFSEQHPADSFDRPEFTLLEAYSCENADPWTYEPLLRGMLTSAVEAMAQSGLLRSVSIRKGTELLLMPWKRLEYSDLVRGLDPAIDLNELLEASVPAGVTGGTDRATLQSEAIAARASDPALMEAAAGLAFKSGGLGPYLRSAPRGYWFDLLDHAVQTKMVPGLREPVIVHRFPLESSPLAESPNGIYCDKWELYAGGVRVALAQKECMDPGNQRVRFEHLARLRREGYDLVPEPDESFAASLEAWPAGNPLIGLGVYVDRLAGIALGLLGDGARGQERMVPNLFKPWPAAG